MADKSIPEDLKNLYREAQISYSLQCYRGTDIMPLIQRIAHSEAGLREMRERLLESGRITDEALAQRDEALKTVEQLLPQRNKWAMVCSRFGYSEKESCAATIIDRILSTEAQLERQQRALEEIIENLPEDRCGDPNCGGECGVRKRAEKALLPNTLVDSVIQMIPPDITEERPTPSQPEEGL